MSKLAELYTVEYTQVTVNGIVFETYYGPVNWNEACRYRDRILQLAAEGKGAAQWRMTECYVKRNDAKKEYLGVRNRRSYQDFARADPEYYAVCSACGLLVALHYGHDDRCEKRSTKTRAAPHDVPWKERHVIEYDRKSAYPAYMVNAAYGKGTPHDPEDHGGTPHD